LEILIGEKKTVKPNTKPIFAILDPITLDIAKSVEPIRADLTLTISSGAEVANETTVIPIKTFGISNFNERETADFKRRFAPAIKTIKPQNNNNNIFKSIIKDCKDKT